MIAGACRRFGLRRVQQTLVAPHKALYRTTLTLRDGDVIVAEGTGVESSLGHALLALERIVARP